MIRPVHCLAMLAACAAPLAAANAAGLDFHTLEYQQPRDPQVGSNVVFTDVHHSPGYQLQPAIDLLDRAIPVGTPRAEAIARLQKAGARCHGSDGTTELCRFRDLETVDEFTDDVTWTVRLALASDKVTGLSVDRAWQRH